MRGSSADEHPGLQFILGRASRTTGGLHPGYGLSTLNVPGGRID